VDSDLEAAAAAADVDGDDDDDDDAILPEPLFPPRVAALTMAERRRNMAVEVGGAWREVFRPLASK